MSNLPQKQFLLCPWQISYKIPLPASSLLLCQTKATLQSPHDPPLSVSHLNICLHFAKLHYQPSLLINMQCSDSLILPLQCCNTQVLFSGIFTFSGIFFVFLPNFLRSPLLENLTKVMPVRCKYHRHLQPLQYYIPCLSACCVLQVDGISLECCHGLLSHKKPYLGMA